MLPLVLDASKRTEVGSEPKKPNQGFDSVDLVPTFSVFSVNIER